jgi:nitrate/TMAO reductase-like tetraheme cytochrome c subunit
MFILPVLLNCRTGIVVKKATDSSCCTLWKTLIFGQPSTVQRMKKYCIIALGCIGLWACTKKTAPSKTIGTTTVSTPVPTAPTPTATTGRINKGLLDRGQQTFVANCGRCHALKQPEAYTQQDWVGIVDRMALKAQLDDKAKAAVLAYLQHHAKDAPKDKSNM